MRRTAISLAAACAAAGLSVGARADPAPAGIASGPFAPAAQLDAGVYVPGGQSLLQQADYFFAWGGRHYCWYEYGWRGPGYYWCGYGLRRGWGWGGPAGWHGWRGGGYRGGDHGGGRHGGGYRSGAYRGGGDGHAGGFHGGGGNHGGGGHGGGGHGGGGHGGGGHGGGNGRHH